MQFWLGIGKSGWLEHTDVPVMLSQRELGRRRRLPRARGPWVLDSGGFSELSMYGEWRTTQDAYLAAVQRYADEIGGMAWAASQDWMCEPWILHKTGLSVLEHQRRSIASYLELRHRAPGIVWLPVLQGWAPDDYLRHVDQYAQAGVDLRSLPVVGIGSVCRRGGVRGAIDLLVRLQREGLRLHGFGLKITAVRALASFVI